MANANQYGPSGSIEDINSLYRAKAEGLSNQQLAQRFGVHPSTISRNLRKAEMVLFNPPATVIPRVITGFGAGEPIPPPPVPPPQVLDPATIPCTPLPERPSYQFGSAPKDVGPTPEEILAKDYDFAEYYGQYCDFLGFKDNWNAPEKKEILEGAEFSVVAADFHVPYEHQEAVKWMIRRTFKKANRLILGGDVADMFYFSKYMKFKQHMSPMEELMRVQAQIAALSEAFDEVIIMRGNHDDRYIKWMKRMGIPVEVFQVFEYLHGQHALHPIYILTKSFKNVKVVEPINEDYAEFSYLFQQGDAIISHAEKYSQIPNKAVGDVIQSMKSFHEPRGVVKPFNVVIQCHTHQAGKTWNDFGVVGIENGCMAMLPDYSGGSKNLPRRNPVLGFTELHQVNGISDLEKTNFIPYQG